jgi:hypothetical protein
MSKITNTYLQNQDLHFEISYTKWLMEAFSEPSESELQEMEDTLYKVSTVKNRIVTLKPLNNIDYQPTIGA